jgi:ribonuclease P protein component
MAFDFACAPALAEPSFRPVAARAAANCRPESVCPSPCDCEAVLPYDNRLRRPADFRDVLANGRRARNGCFVIHHVVDRTDGHTVGSDPIVGFVVGRSVGNSVARHRVARRLRAQMALRLADLAATSATVVRALPGAAEADSATIARDLDSAFGAVTAPGRSR